MQRALMLVILLAAARTDAQVAVTVDLNAEGQALATRLGVSEQDLAMRIEERVNDAYGVMNIDGFLRKFTDATAFSLRGLGVDYASMPKTLILGVGINFAVAASEQVTAEERPTGGLAANLAFMAGLNLSSYDHPRWTIFANGFYREASTTSLEGGLASGGVHVQYRIVQPEQDSATQAVARWTGIDITTGIEGTRWSLGVEDEIDTPFAVEGTSGSAMLTLASMGRFDLTATAVTVPIEVSTAMRLAMLISIYVGAGVDFTSGKGKLDTNLTGTLRTDDAREVGTTLITGGGENGASPVAGRILAGAQLNLWKLKVYAQVNGSSTPAANVGFGIRGVL